MGVAMLQFSTVVRYASATLKWSSRNSRPLRCLSRWSSRERYFSSVYDFTSTGTPLPSSGVNRPLCSSVPMKHSHCCDMLQDRGVLGQDHAVIGAHDRHQAKRVDGVEVGIVLQDLLGPGVDLDEVGL